MDNEPEVIRQQMAETRASMADKLETLEEKVVGTVEGATTAVNETVENVKDAVQETVSTVKDTVSGTVEGVKEAFDLQRQVERHPCVMMGAAAAVGYVAGSLLSQSKGQASRLPPDGSEWRASQLEARPTWQPREGAAPASRPLPAEAPVTKQRGTWAPELARLKGLAIGYFMGAVRDAMSESLPQGMRDQFRETIDSITFKLGGEPIRGPVISGCSGATASNYGRGQRSLEGRSTRRSFPDGTGLW
jgi:ElaB/YqjD/DUF883 family membrane-anchored ribosome-binding protein